MKNKPELYHSTSDKIIHNNREIFMSNDKSNYEYNGDIRKKINEIVSGNDFIYLKKVNIVIGNNILSKKIIGVYNDSLVTIDNEYIPIDNIKDIYK